MKQKELALHSSLYIQGVVVLASFFASAEANGLAVMPCRIALSITVQITTMAICSAPGNDVFKTIMANTILAKPRGPNQERNSLVPVFSPLPVNDKNIRLVFAMTGAPAAADVITVNCTLSTEYP